MNRLSAHGDTPDATTGFREAAANFFEAVEGRRSEDLVTQTLLVILGSPAFRELQRLFYQRILRDEQLLCTEARRFLVRTQQVDAQLGRPDLSIEGEETFVLIENKFTALFTPSQMPRYLQILEKSSKRICALVLLCPSHLQSQYEREALSQFAARGVSKPTFSELQQHLQKEKLTALLVICWEELLRLFDSNHFLVTELTEFIRERYLVHVEFTAQEILKIMTAEIPEVLEKIQKLVDRVKGEVEGNGVTVGRSTQSFRYWGFYLYKSGRCFYFGYMLEHWAEFESPLFLQVSPRWDENAGMEEESLIESGMKKAGEETFVMPIRMQLGDEHTPIGVVVRDIHTALEKVVGNDVAEKE